MYNKIKRRMQMLMKCQTDPGGQKVSTRRLYDRI